MQKDSIIQYYDTCEEDYRLLWDLDHSQAMHAGYWDNETRSLREALKKENEILAIMAEIKEGDRILDAGCGVGGSAIYLAQTYECYIDGITLSAKQVQRARENAAHAKVKERICFHEMDYTKTNFSDHTFDVIWAIESVCHADDKRLFVREAKRLLKKEGRLIIADGFAKNSISSYRDQAKMKCWLKGWGVESLEDIKAFHNILRKEGFENIQFINITKNVIPSSRRLYWYSLPAIPLSKFGEWLGFRTYNQTANLLSAMRQYQTLKKELWQYGIFLARV